MAYSTLGKKKKLTTGKNPLNKKPFSKGKELKRSPIQRALSMGGR